MFQLLKKVQLEFHSAPVRLARLQPELQLREFQLGLPVAAGAG